MKRKFDLAAYFAIVAALLIGSASAAVAQTRRSERDVRDAVRSLLTQIDNYESDLRYRMQSTSDSRDLMSNVSDDLSTLKDRIRQFQNNLDRKRENRDDVNAIVDAALTIEEFMQANPQNGRVADDWAAVRKQIERIGSNYGVIPNWSGGPTGSYDDRGYSDNDGNGGGYNNNFPPDRNGGNNGGYNNYPPNNGGMMVVGLSGTYDIDTQRSENIDDVLSSTDTSGTDREDLRNKLTAPGQIALDIRGNQVTIASSTTSPVSFVADGRDNTEQGPNGQSIRTRATLSGDKLVISSLGGDNDYTVTFTSALGGKELKVSRRITTPYLSQTVFAESVYTRSDSVARLGIDNGGYNNNGGGYSDNDQNNGTYGSSGTYGNGAPVTGLPRTGRFIVPDGMMITANLDTDIDTKASQNNDRFRMTVQSPDQFRGAVIDGYISGVNRSGQISGRSNVTFNFERITLRDGSVYDFAGNLSSIRDHTGKVVKVDPEGSARGDNQTKTTATRGGIGAGIGAIIGAIAGGAKGAVLGAVIGGGAGAGSVAIQGKDDLKLMRGSTITVISSSPIRGGGNYPDK